MCTKNNISENAITIEIVMINSHNYDIVDALLIFFSNTYLSSGCGYLFENSQEPHNYGPRQ